MNNLSIKSLSNLSKLLIILLITSSSISCSFNETVKGNRILATEERGDINGFSKIHISAGLRAEITQGEKDFVEVEADENILKYIITEVSNNNTLNIHWKKGTSIRRFKKAVVHISIKTLKEVHASSGSDAKSINIIKSEKIKLKASSGADINIIVEAKNVSANASSGANIDVKGSTDRLNADASSGADIDADELTAQYVNANASSAGDIKVRAIQSINANASSAGNIDYYGNPKETNNHESSGGDIDKR